MKHYSLRLKRIFLHKQIYCRTPLLKLIFLNQINSSVDLVITGIFLAPVFSTILYSSASLFLRVREKIIKSLPAF